MGIPYKYPIFNGEAFNCPYCRAYAKQSWYSPTYFGGNLVPNLRISLCSHCHNFAFWLSGKLISPEDLLVPSPNSDLNEDLKADYLEASHILQKSPRGAAALLRLCIQKLCQQLGEPGKNINNDIANLVKKGLPATVQQALDIVRVVGNEAVHPGQLDLKDDVETAIKLFELINIIAKIMISQPKEIQKLYGMLPEDKRLAIEKRDS